MVSEINSGGLPPVNLPQGQHEAGETTQSQAGKESGSNPGPRSVTDNVKSTGTISGTLATLVDDTLGTDTAKQVASSVAEALGGHSLSIANADPSTIPGLSS